MTFMFMLFIYLNFFREIFRWATRMVFMMAVNRNFKMDLIAATNKVSKMDFFWENTMDFGRQHSKQPTMTDHPMRINQTI